MESISNFLEKFNKREINETEMQLQIILLERAKILSDDREHKEGVPPRSGVKELAFKYTKLYKDKICLSS